MVTVATNTRNQGRYYSVQDQTLEPLDLVAQRMVKKSSREAESSQQSKSDHDRQTIQVLSLGPQRSSGARMASLTLQIERFFNAQHRPVFLVFDLDPTL
jgi:hypothetical protein